MTAVAPRVSRRRVAMAALVGLTLVVLGAVAAWQMAPWSAVEPLPSARVAIDLPPGQQLVVGPSPALALSGDGRRLVYVAAQPGSLTQLYLRPLDRFDVSAIPGTEGASAPFFAPDGNWIGFYARDAIQKVSLDGGTPLKICDAPPLSGATWLQDGGVIFGTTLIGDGLWRVSADGGTPERLTTPDAAQKEVHHLYPHASATGDAASFSIRTDQGSFGAVLSLESREWRRLPQVRPIGGSKRFEYNDPSLFVAGLPGPGCGGLVGGFTCASVSFDEFDPQPGNLTLLLGTGGVKFNPVGDFLISASLLFPLTKAGLRSRLTTVVGIDYAF